MLKKIRYLHYSKIFNYLIIHFVLTNAKIVDKNLTTQIFIINILFIFILKGNRVIKRRHIVSSKNSFVINIIQR